MNATRLCSLFLLAVLSGAALGGEIGDTLVVGASRPATVHVPPSYARDVPAPLLFLLHGRFGTGAGVDRYFRMNEIARERGVVYVHPDGRTHTEFSTIWDAYGYCPEPEADFGFDDSAYLRGLIEEVIERGVNVDPDRIFVAGFSNGGRMAHLMGCEHADRVTAVASLSGGTTPEPGLCPASEPVHVLNIQGTNDQSFNGGTFGPFPSCSFPGAEETAELWAEINGCLREGAQSDVRLDLDAASPGSETTIRRYTSGCESGGSAELWVLQGAEHVPSLVQRGATTELAFQVLDWLLSHPRRESPVSMFTVTQTPELGALTVSFDASESVDPQGTTLTRFHWDFGDGTRGEGQRVAHSYARAGNYSASLTVVTDDLRTALPAQRWVELGCPAVDISPWLTASIGGVAGGARPGTGGGPDSLRVCSTGRGFGSETDELFFVYKAMQGDGRVVTRVPELSERNAAVAVLLRESLAPGARFAASVLDSRGVLAPVRRFEFRRRRETGAASASTRGEMAGSGGWLRIERRGDLLISEVSLDGSAWTILGEDEIPGATETLLAGLAVAANPGADDASDVAVTDLRTELSSADARSCGVTARATAESTSPTPHALSTGFLRVRHGQGALPRRT